jgi:UDP-2-acetamido-2,6-beta-L-arabino-hexul-4-ose reductase
MKVLVTGSKGFIGRNLVLALQRQQDVRVLMYDRGDSDDRLNNALTEADVTIHLAGVNRPENEKDYEQNVDLAQLIYNRLARLDYKSKLIFASSTQATEDNAYGRSKLRAEQIFIKLGSRAKIVRLPNVFGKWCRPNYNSAVATFCHRVARNIPIKIDDPEKYIYLVHVEDVINMFIRLAYGIETRLSNVTTVTIEELATTIQAFHDYRGILKVPDISNRFMKNLYSTYLSYIPNTSVPVIKMFADERGSFAELIKFHDAGQISVLKVEPGKERGGHYHDRKIEKFVVLSGEGTVYLSLPGEKSEHFENACGDDLRVIDIPPGYIHSIENTGHSELIVLIWTSEIFDHKRADTWTNI